MHASQIFTHQANEIFHYPMSGAENTLEVPASTIIPGMPGTCLVYIDGCRTPRPGELGLLYDHGGKDGLGRVVEIRVVTELDENWELVMGVEFMGAVGEERHTGGLNFYDPAVSH